MPTTIDLENAKQIRQPMDVLITLGKDSQTTTGFNFSQYGSAAVHDTANLGTGLKNGNIAMRKLTDLQGNGFPLDGSHRWLNYSEYPTRANGKVGLRGHIGQSLSFKITHPSYSSIGSVTIHATGALDVIYDDTAHEIPTSGYITLSISGSTAAFEFTPAYNDRRIEVSLVMQGVFFSVSQDELISCTVALRSDLQPVSPTLPESEMEVQFYYDEDISEVLAEIPNDTPLTYSAGYDDDVSETRKFYTSDKVSWENNVITIRGVDAVHKLEGQMIYPILVGTVPAGAPNLTSIDELPLLMLHELMKAEISTSVEEEVYRKESPTAESMCIVAEQPARDFIAFMNNMHLYGMNFTETIEDFWPTFVDAGIPRLSLLKPEPKWDIYEEDCSDVKRSVEKKTGAYRYTKTKVSKSDTGSAYWYTDVGSGTWLEGSGIFISPDDYVFYASVEFGGGTSGDEYVRNIPGWVTGDTSTNVFYGAYIPDVNDARLGAYLLGPDIPKGTMSDSGNDWNTQVLSWNTGQSSFWSQYVAPNHPNDDQVEVNLIGAKCLVDTTENQIHTLLGRTGDTVDIQIDNLIGEYNAGTAGGSDNLFPRNMLKYLLLRSNITGSFTWKGDPRMQPRDVVRFHRLDGTVEEITIETITLKHEGGGTTAEITYRKGVV